MTTGDWDYENAEVHEGEDNVASVYRVPFSASEIATIRAAAAKRRGMTTTEFIQRAALERTKS